MKVGVARILFLAALCVMSGTTAARAGWHSITPGFDAVIVSVAVDPVAPTRLYAIPFIYQLPPKGLFRSDDGGGSTWIELDLVGVERLAINPVSTETIYATTNGGRLYRSPDRGATWAALSVGDPNAFVTSVALDPGTPTVLHAGTQSSGMFKSVDGGDHWTRSAGIPDDVWVDTITVNPATPMILYATTRQATTGQQDALFRSADRGDTWARADDVPDGVGPMVFDPVTSTRVYVATRLGVFRSDDAGETWMATAGLTRRVVGLAVHPDSPEILYASVYDFDASDDRGLFKTTNGGEHWERLNDGLGPDSPKPFPVVGPVLFDTASPRRLYAANYAGIFVSEDGGESWAALAGIDRAPELVLAPVGAGRLYAFGDAGLYRFDLPTFADVSLADPLLPWIEALHAGGLTDGCATGPPEFCPDDIVTRAQAAVFVVRGVLGPGVVPPPATGAVFDDVTPASLEAPWIEQLSGLGLTAGCGPRRYCPAASLSRGQASVLLLRARRGAGYQPPAPSGAIFADVPASHPFAAWIEQLAEEGIAAGCETGPVRFCPDAPTTRAAMAVLLVHTFGLPLPFGPPLQ